MTTSIESEINKKNKGNFCIDLNENSTDSDILTVFEESNSEANLKKRKLVHKKSHQSKKTRRLNSDSYNEELSVTSGDKFMSTKKSQNNQDIYCWICHKTENIISCHFCPRGYHHECLLTFFAQNQFDKNELTCPECITIMMSECTININSGWKTINQKDLNEMLSFVLLRLYNINGSSQFQTAVDIETIRDYYVIIKHPIHLNLLKSRVSKNKYRSVHAFFSDFKWILHNCTIYNGIASVLTSYARNLEKLCVKELNLLKSCPECFKERMPFMIKVLNEQNKCNSGKGNVLDKSRGLTYDEDLVDDMWMTKLCKLIHPLVWVRLHSYPIWPGKLISLDEESALVLFFGDYDLNIVPIGSICVHTQSNHKRLLSNIANFTSRRPINSALVTNSFTKEYQLALEELNVHLDNIKNKFEHFTIPNKKIEFNILKGVEYYERLRMKRVKEPNVTVSNSIDDVHSREDCISDITTYDRLELKCDVEKVESISSASVTSLYPTSALKSNRESSSGPAFLQNFEHNVHNLVNKLKKECLSYFKCPGQDDNFDEFQAFKPMIESQVQSIHQQTDRVPMIHAAAQFSSKQFEKEEELIVYTKYLEQCLATSEIELRRHEIVSALRHEEYIMEFTKQQKEMKKLCDNDSMEVMKMARNKIEDKFARSIRILKTNEWCAFCGKLARFYCCWNTCYCNQECQTKHWEIHKTGCSQINRQPQPIGRTNSAILNTPPLNGMQNLISKNGDSVNMNGSNTVDFSPNGYKPVSNYVQGIRPVNYSQYSPSVAPGFTNIHVTNISLKPADNSTMYSKQRLPTKR